MAQWYEELDALLAQLRVDLGETMPAAGTGGGDGGPSLAPPPGVSDSDAAIARDLALPAEGEEPPDENEEVSAVRSEIEATLGRVLALARAGRMDGDMRDDVIYVLQALTRPHPGTTVPMSGEDAAATRDEWQLASAAAVLRFCRMVMRLTNALAVDQKA
jgi:hypothetical protein